jgi:hypothetical protein
MGVQIFSDQEPQQLIRSGSATVNRKAIQSGIHNRLYRCAVFIGYASFTNLTAGRVTQFERHMVREARVGDLCFNLIN